MIFASYLGHATGVADWRAVVEAHATWCRMEAKLTQHTLRSGATFATAWIARAGAAPPPVLHQGDRLVSSMFPQDAGAHPNASQVIVDERAGTVAVTVPLATPDSVFAIDHQGSWLLANDLRLLARWSDGTLDPAGIYGLFQYGIAPAPLTPFAKVQRLPRGHTWRASPGQQPDVARDPLPTPTVVSAPGSSTEDQVASALDTVLGRLPAGTVITFSGGVDSALLAARAVAMGRTDMVLANFAFGVDDPESKLALEMADHFGLPCERVVFSPEGVAGVLERSVRDYTAPFVDIASFATHALLAGIGPGSQAAGAVIDGVGADAAFGLGPKVHDWRRIYDLPIPLRIAVSQGYRRLHLWEGTTRAEEPARLVRRSLQMALPHASSALNALDGVVYDIPTDARARIEGALVDYVDVLTTGLDEQSQLSVFTLAATVAPRSAKAFDPLRLAGVEPVFPYLEPEVLGLAFALPWDVRCAGGELKAPLKALLARAVPREWVYRKKQGLIPPMRDVLARPEVQAMFRDVVLGPDAMLAGFWKEAEMRRLLDRTRAGRPLTHGVYNLLWAVLFTSLWLDQLATGARLAEVRAGTAA